MITIRFAGSRHVPLTAGARPGRMRASLSAGFTLMELMVVVAVIGLMASVAIPKIGIWNANERVKAAGRGMAAAISLAHGEAVRTGDLHIIFFRTDAQGNTLFDTQGTAVPILVINDGTRSSANQNCRIDAGEIIGAIKAETMSTGAWPARPQRSRPTLALGPSPPARASPIPALSTQIGRCSVPTACQSISLRPVCWAAQAAEVAAST